MSASCIDQYATIFRELANKQCRDDEFVGRLRLDQQTVDTLKALRTQNLTTGVYNFFKNGTEAGSADLDQIGAQHFIDEIQFEVDLQAQVVGKDFVVYQNWNSLLAYADKIRSPVKNIFFTDTEQTLFEGCGDPKFENYLRLQNVVSLIERLASSTGGGNNTIFYERPLAFSFVLKEDDLEYAIDVKAINKLLEKDLHQEAITFLICSELVGFLKDIEVNQRFSYMIKHLSSLVSNVLLSYQSYVENYSFDKVRKEYLEKRSEYISEIHGVFDDISLKLLSLPAGLWFATSQISSSVDAPIENPKNLVVLITVILVAAILILNIYGQFATIRAIKSTYTEIFDGIEKQFEDEKEQIGKARRNIDSAACKVKLKLYFSIFVALVLVGLTFLLFKESGSLSYAHELVKSTLAKLPCF